MMTTPGSTTQAPPSTSTPARPSKLTVRHKQRPLFAEAVSERRKVWLPGNQLVYVAPGDYVITDGLGTVVNVANSLDEYEVIEEGTFIPATLRPDIERVLGLGALATPTELVRAIDRLARLEIGGVLVDFTPGQWAELRHKATIQDQTVEEYLIRLVKRFTQDLWTL